MNFKAHRRNRSFLIAHTERQKFERRHLESTEQPPPVNNLLLQQAKEAYYKDKNFRVAIQLFEQYLTTHPHHDECLYLCGVACLHINRSQEAIERLILVGKDYEHHANAMLLSAIAYNKIGGASKSFEIIQKCIRQYPQFEQALCFRGRLFMERRSYIQAENDFRAAVELPLSSFLSFMGLGDCHRVTNRFESAIQLYGRAQKMLKTAGMDSKTPIYPQLQLKAAICLYFLQDYQSALQKLYLLRTVDLLKGSQLYYYIGLCEDKLHKRQKALLSLEYSMKLQSNTQFVEKAYKRLVRMYLQEFQFYEALNVVKLGQKYGINLQNWKKIVEGFMLTIKGNYNAALEIFAELMPIFKVQRLSKLQIKKITKQLSQLSDQPKLKPVKRPNKQMFNDSPKSLEKIGVYSSSWRRKSESYSKSVSKALAKIGSVSNSKHTVRASNEVLRHRTEHFTSSIMKPISPQQKEEHDPYFNVKQRQLLYPLLLKFKGYCQFFEGNYLQSMQTYDLYDTYVKDMFGKQSEMHYNKLLCEGMLLSEEDLADQALAKFSECVEYYYEKYKEVAVEPILHKLALLIKLAAIKLEEDDDESVKSESQVATGEQIITSTLKMIQNYQMAIAQHPLAYFYQSLVYIFKEDFVAARECLQKTLKIAEECTWKYLYVKGVVEMALQNYYGAVKEFSAGLILQVRPELFLGRSICLLMLSQQSDNKISEEDMNKLMKSVSISTDLTTQVHKVELTNQWKGKGKGQVLLQKCFSDLQSFIQLSNNEQQISTWVSRILFTTKSFQQAASSMLKVETCSNEFMQMTECIEIYEGEYQNGGSVGLLIKSAFDGKFLDESEEDRLLEENSIKNYNNPIYQYLTKDYQKWLVILHLYIRQNYPLLLKYMQRQLFCVKNETNELFLRYNICIVYLLMDELGKATNLAKSLLKFQDSAIVNNIVKKLLESDYEKDQCLEELKEEFGIGEKRLLSNFLPYRSVSMVNSRQQKIQVFVRVNIPFPRFPLPQLQLRINKEFILKEVGPGIIQKKIEAPWVRRMNNHMVQFTENLEESRIQSAEWSSKGTSTSRLASELDPN